MDNHLEIMFLFIVIIVFSYYLLYKYFLHLAISSANDIHALLSLVALNTTYAEELSAGSTSCYAIDACCLAKHKSISASSSIGELDVSYLYVLVANDVECADSTLACLDSVLVYRECYNAVGIISNSVV
jgi:hypothetical protein